MTKPVEPQWTSAAVSKLAENLLAEWKPFLRSEGEKLLAEQVAQLWSLLLQLREATAANCASSGEAKDLAQEVRAQMATSVAAVTKRLEQLER